MRNLNLILTPVLMATLMISGVRYFRSNGQHWLTNGGSTATTPSTMRVAAVTSILKTTDQPTPALRPIPDVISEEIKSWPKSQRHVASLHPEMITPGNFEYLGAFIPPHFEDNEDSFAYSLGTLAFRANPDRPETATTLAGSLFLAGHSQQQRVAEISIPKPVLSPLKRAEDLPRAEMLQPFSDITHGIMQDLSDA